MSSEQAMAAKAGSGPTDVGWLWALPLVLVAAMVAMAYLPAVIGWVAVGARRHLSTSPPKPRRHPMTTAFTFEQEWVERRPFSATDLTVKLRIEHNAPDGDAMRRIGDLIAAVERHLNDEATVVREVPPATAEALLAAMDAAARATADDPPDVDAEIDRMRERDCSEGTAPDTEGPTR